MIKSCLLDPRRVRGSSVWLVVERCSALVGGEVLVSAVVRAKAVVKDEIVAVYGALLWSNLENKLCYGV